jgi:hypothetical protein
MDQTPNQPAINRALNLISQATNLLAGASPIQSTPDPISSTQIRTPVGLTAPNSQIPDYGQQYGTPLRNPTVISELRRNFEPYQRTAVRGRNVGRPTQVTNRPPAPWSHRFCCLAGPSDANTPSRNRLTFLQSQNLGHENIFLGRCLGQMFPTPELFRFVTM